MVESVENLDACGWFQWNEWWDSECKGVWLWKHWLWKYIDVMESSNGHSYTISGSVFFFWGGSYHFWCVLSCWCFHMFLVTWHALVWLRGTHSSMFLWLNSIHLVPLPVYPQIEHSSPLISLGLSPSFSVIFSWNMFLPLLVTLKKIQKHLSFCSGHPCVY